MNKIIGYLALALALTGCAKAEDKAAPADEATVYVDVRDANEFAAGHIAGAIHIPHDQMPQRWRELEPYRDRPMVVYCRTGRRSAIALETLHAQGFELATNGGALEDVAATGQTVTTE